MASEASTGHSAFFYGTLMHPKILTRVINNTGAHLRFCPAVLLRADYPGVVSYSEGKQLFSRELSLEERSVRGTLVTGLSDSDMALLDFFEGSEYTRQAVSVHPLSELKDFDLTSHPLSRSDEASLVPTHPPPLPDTSELLPPVEAETYIFKYVRKLEPELWSFEDFVAKNARKWYSNDWNEEEYEDQELRELWNGADARGSVIERRLALDLYTFGGQWQIRPAHNRALTAVEVESGVEGILPIAMWSQAVEMNWRRLNSGNGDGGKEQDGIAQYLWMLSAEIKFGKFPERNWSSVIGLCCSHPFLLHNPSFRLNLPRKARRDAMRLASIWSLRHGSMATRRFYASVAAGRVPQTFIEKVVQKYAVGLPEGKVVKAGDYVMIKPEHVMTHDNTGPVISKCATKIHNPSQPVFTLDHDVQNRSSKNLQKYANIEAFARQHGVDFYPAGRGIGHQVLVEEGYAFPHTLTVASDSHSNMYGGVGCVGTPIVRTDAAALWATGKTWWQVPRMVKVELKGKLAPGVTGKDVIVALCGSFNKDEVLNAAIEFTGEGVSTLSVDERLTIANMTTEWGALAGVFPVDETLLSWYDRVLNKLELRTFASPSSSAIPPPPTHPRLNRERLSALRQTPLSSDSGAEYSSHLVFDLSTLVPHVSGPNSVKVSTPLPTLESQKIPINKAYLVSCTNSRVSDIAAAAAVVRGHKIAPGVEFYIAAASSNVQQESEALGDWDALIQAGAKTLPAGCGPCIGLGTGLLEDGEIGISATNRNYKGRMGSPNAQAYLASPAVVAASAINGFISGPASLDPAQLPPAGAPTYTISEQPASAASSVAAENEPLLEGFPPAFSGPLLFAPQDNLNTDGIYPGKYTYQDDITLERQAEVVMENYDPGFASLVASLRKGFSTSEGSSVKPGVVLVAGYNFGTGSSREQAATALKSAGVPLVIAGSFGDIFKRNAINNGLVCLESPELVADLTAAYTKDGKRGAGGKDGELTVDKGLQVVVNMENGNVTVTTGGVEKVYKVKPVGASVQELWLCGGLEGYILKEIQKEAAASA
ncbi:homoaconitate hydratase [Coprinopsis cinerea okayama7|uniref:Homoaconitase, mitochondrial n=1 Tax=Coprinopsis cinerea (strain Okayama-7 / 130 / ATCC MYA-4618 / FGSC 9003) TaxID=240176 RepID=D6RM87_COPC7|nr:homoaconitate hydratase [Coprinopsis cinerea okayama7\|eukprot:XP_002911394.1 homoaconitate hydratase [Coprinopsis cinerea okayama7\